MTNVSYEMKCFVLISYLIMRIKNLNKIYMKGLCYLKSVIKFLE